jgi:flagellar biogenesis protein FliO
MLKNNIYEIQNLSINRVEEKKFQNGLKVNIGSLTDNSVKIQLNYSTNLTIKASVTAKGYGLRLRILGFKTTNKIKNPLFNSQQMVKTEEDSFNMVNYFIMVSILIILTLILFIIKKKLKNNLPSPFQKDNYKMLYQKQIDPKNRIVMIEIFDKKYLLLLGANNNILLDNFSQKHQEELKDISSQNEFGQLLDEKLNEELNNETAKYIKKASKLKDLNEI